MIFPDQYRKPHPLGFEHKPGDPFGWFEIPRKVLVPMGAIKLQGMRIKTITFAVMADAQTDWEHVSISLPDRCPTWDEMCWIKSLFWSPEDCVVQYHPPESEYVNNAKFCLHLWKYAGQMPRPPAIYVGVKS